MSNTVFTYELVRYRDAGLPTFTYFWVSSEKRIVSPYFDSEEEAHKWMAIPSVAKNKDPDVTNRWVTDCAD